MQISYRATISMVLGIALGIFLPIDMFKFSGNLSLISDSFLIMWRYLVYPYLFFSLVVAVAQLKRDHRLSKMFLMNTFLALGLSLIFSITATFLGAILPIKRIPVQLEKIFSEAPILPTSFLESILPINALSIFSQPFLLPMVIFAILLGLNLSFDREVTEPTYNFFDSLSRIFYHIFDRIMQFAWIPVFFFTVNNILELRKRELINYNNFLFFIFGTVILSFFIITTLLCYFFSKDKNPFTFWKHVILYLPFTLFCRNIQLNGCIASHYSHKKLAIKRDVTGVITPLLILFGKSGSIFVCNIAMITILRSYSSLNLHFSQLVLICISTFLASFLACHRYENIFLFILTTACTIYGNPLVTGSHILDPVMIYLILLASFIDSIMILFAIVFIANFKKLFPHKIHTNHLGIIKPHHNNIKRISKNASQRNI